ncbi:hypothetical protein AvCA_33630 [Azotobacter vinelandii CA]|uniref:Uncharacterized protein n=2 Tax=Azotobacter vinelandii TaxID=354 RepID=C1DPU2_AZOVD|nr:hypothetical protein Avin_33630 [Azotobacter vinelandii DJ]AGK16348.1 hypothetical protein AvCA_33630 [Azotobacter vinelandii CA]AGK21284.1 hypothetical protein AvCA6_33630 [Azotobacter vinelandii CA6]
MHKFPFTLEPDGFSRNLEVMPVLYA